jgi:hypothetical protein
MKNSLLLTFLVLPSDFSIHLKCAAKLTTTCYDIVAYLLYYCYEMVTNRLRDVERIVLHCGLNKFIGTGMPDAYKAS